MSRLINLGAHYGPEWLSRVRAGEFSGRGPVAFASEELAEAGTSFVPELAAGSTAAVAIGYGIGRLATNISGRKRKREEDMSSMAMDDIPVIGGDRMQANRVTQKRRLKRGRLGRKLDSICEDYIQRWQRIYPYGTNTDAYPASFEEDNPGCTNSVNWPTTPVPEAGNYGRLALSHVINAKNTGAQFLPGYLIDITCWNNSTNTYSPVPVKRVGILSTGQFQWIPIAQNFNRINYQSDRMDWGPESGPSGTGLPNSSEQKAVLSWSDIRLLLFGARNFCTKVTIEFVQFKDAKFTMNYHEDGEGVGAMTTMEQNEVNQFWANEFKKFTFSPIDVQQYNRKKAVTVLHHEEFCVNADNQSDLDTNPVGVVKTYFKRFNRLVNWRWNRPNTTVTFPAGLDNPDFQQADQGQNKGFADPKARIYLYIRAEDFIPSDRAVPMSEAATREVTFDLVMRNKWRVQT